MNKIFKVVWSKTKECYVVVSEVAKNNGGKKKVLASVLAGFAMVSLASAPAQAADMNTDTSANTAKQINIWANTQTKGNPASGGSSAPGSGVANANDVKPSQYGDEISIAIGGQNSINTTDTTSPGSGGSGYAIGNKNKIKGNRNVALGTENKTYGDDSIAIGHQTVSGTGHGIAIGSINGTTQTVAYGSANPSETASSAFGFALAIGSGAQADGRANGASGGIAIGQLVKATNNNTIAIGVNTTASGNNAVAVGGGAQATQRISTAYGPNANANSAGGVAIGTDAAVGTDTGLTTVIAGATAVGANAQAQSTSGSAFGRNAKADKNAENATALGAFTTANIAGGVALGSNSVTTTAAGVPGYNPATGRTNKYSDQTGAIGTSTLAAVSVGNGTTATRQITGLAAGTADTDAVNVAQLKNVNLKFAGDSTKVTGSTDVRLNDGTFNVNGDGTLISTEATATGIKVTAKVGGTINANNDGKVVAPATNGIATTTNVTDAINKSGWNIVSSNNGGSVTGTQATKLVNPGSTVTLSAGKNIVLDQNDKQFTYSLNKDVDLTNAGSLTVGGTKVNNDGVTITAPTGGTTTNVTLTQSGLDNGGNKIVNVKDGDVSATSKDAVNGSQLYNVKAAERHIKPGTYNVDTNGNVTMTYLDGNGGDVPNDKAIISGIAKQDLSNITNAGKQVITGLSNKVVAGDNVTVDETEDTTTKQKTYKVNAKLAQLDNGTNTTVSGNGTAASPYRVNVAGDLTGITSIANTTGGPTMTFGGNSINITGGTLNLGGNKITNVANGDVNATSKDAVNGSQLYNVDNKFNNTVELTGNTGSTAGQALNKANGLSFGVVGADNGKYITTAASGSNVVADLSADAKAKLNNKVVVTGSGAATVATPTVTTNSDGTTVTTYTVHVDPATATAASTEKVKKAANGANDTNIADVNPQTGDTYGAANATYEVSVSRNAVKDAAREAVTVNNGGTTTGGTYTADTNNPISVTAVPDNTNHNTTYAVTFDGNKAAKQIPLTYKATNGTTTTADQTVKLDKGLNFTGGDYTTASVGADGKVTFDVNLGTAPTVTDGKPGVPGQAGAAGKDGIATVKTVVDTINNSGWKANAKANGGKLDGTATATVVKPGNTVNYAAGKNLIVNQELEKDASNALTGNQTYTYSLNKDIDLTNAGSLTVGDTTVNNGGITIKAPTPAAGATATTDVKLTNTGLDNGGNKIVNVAGGTADTDAVNVKQLKDAKTVLADGKNTTKSGSGTAADPYKVNVEGDLTDITSITNKADASGNAGKITFSPNQTVTVSGDHNITLDAGSGHIGGLTNLTFNPNNYTSGQAATEDQLKSVHDTLKANERHIAPTTVAAGSTENKGGTANAAGTANVYKYDATNKTVTLTYNDGNGNAVNDTKAVIDFSALNTGGTTASTWTAKTSAENTTAGSEIGKHAGDTSQVIGNQNSVDFQAGRNMTVTQTNDSNGNTTINYALDKDLTNLDKVVVNGENGTNGKDGVTIIGPQGATGMPGTNGIDGKVGITGKDGKDAVSISGKDGIGTIGLTGPQGPAGADGRGVDITTDHGTQTLNKPEANNGGKSERIVYVPKDKDGNPLKDDAGNTIKREVATMDDGLKFAGDDAQGTDKTKVIAKKLNETVDIIGGANKADLTADNIGVNNDGNGKLLVQLSKNLKGLDSVQTKTVELGDHTTPGGTTNITYNTGDNRIEYTTPGATPGTTDTKKVATTDDIWTIQGNGTDVKPVNGKVNVKAGDNVVIKTPTTADGSMTISAVTSAVYTKADGTKVYKIIDPTTGAVTWNTKADGTGTPVNASDVIVSFQDADGNTTGGGSIVNNVGSAIDKTGTSTGNAFLTKLDTAATNTPNAAVNVKDLKNTSDALINKGLNFTGNNDATVNAHKLGSLVKVQGEGVTAAQVAGFQSAAGNIAVVANSTDTLEIKLNKNLKGINSVSNGSSSITLNSNPGGTNNTPAVQITGGNLSMGDGTTNGNNKIVNLAPGTDNNDAVNVKQLKTAKTVVEAGTNVTVNKTTGANGEDVYTVSATGGGTGTASSWNVKSTGNTDPTSETAAKNISNGKTVEMAAGKNLTVKQTSDANGAKVEFALNKDLSNLDKIVVNGNDGATGQAGVSIVGPKGANGVDGNDGKVGIAGKDGKDAVSISGKDGVGHIGLQGPKGTPGTPGADGASLDISTDHGTQTLVKPEANNNNKSERIVYVPKDKDGNPLKDTDGNTIKREVATMDDGLKFAGDDGQANQDTNPNVIKKQLNNVVDIIGGADKTKLTDNNIGVNNDNGKLKVQLSKEIDLTPSGKLTIGDTTVNKDGVTIANGPSITKTGVDAGNKKITNVANGDVNATSKDAVNGSQLYQAMQDAKTHLDHGQNTTVSGTGTQADPYKVNVQGDLNKISSITNNAGDGKVKFDPNQTVTVAGDHNISLNGKTGDITGLTNTSIGGADFATKGRAATEEQLKEAMNTSVEKVKKSADGANDKNIAEVNPTGGATNYGKAGTTYEVSVSRNAVESNARLSYTDNGNPSKKVTLSEGLNFKNGTNTTARTEPNGQVFYDVNPNLQNISSISGSTTGNGPRISFNNAGANSTVNIDGGNLNMGGNKITNLGKGTATTDAATVGQLTKVTSNNHSVVVTKTTDADGAPVYDLAVTGTPGAPAADPRVDMLGEEIGRVGAQGAALSALKPIQYDPLEPTQIMAGYGNYRGNSALALGVAHYKNESTLIHGGVSWAGGSSHMMANAGVTWKVGNRDSEAAVADRYRKGPISSAYAMQQEMAAMKAQNAGLKGEVSDLKAENEQMKAQIAAMMAKLGL